MHKFWAILFGAVLLGCALLFVIAPIMNWWLPTNHASFGDSTDNLFYLILIITGITIAVTIRESRMPIRFEYIPGTGAVVAADGAI